MGLHAEMIDAEVLTLHENDCRVVFVGRREGLDPGLLAKMEWAEELTADNKRMTLFVAFTTRQAEIVDAVRAAAAAGTEATAITEDDMARHLYSPLMRDPDLCIRTSGETIVELPTLAGRLLELVFVERLWPDFSKEDFPSACRVRGRERRFGARSKDTRA